MPKNIVAPNKKGRQTKRKIMPRVKRGLTLVSRKKTLANAVRFFEAKNGVIFSSMNPAVRRKMISVQLSAVAEERIALNKILLWSKNFENYYRLVKNAEAMRKEEFFLRLLLNHLDKLSSRKKRNV